MTKGADKTQFWSNWGPLLGSRTRLQLLTLFYQNFSQACCLRAKVGQGDFSALIPQPEAQIWVSWPISGAGRGTGSAIFITHFYY
jgi:hypothetical protein